MRWKCFREVETSRGVLKYRMPNILEIYDILESSEITKGQTSEIKLKRNIIGILGPMLDISGVDGMNSFD